VFTHPLRVIVRHLRALMDEGSFRHSDEDVDGMDIADTRGGARPEQHVRLVYHYKDGHDFTTETMLRRDAVAYMPVLHAVCVDAEHYEAPFAQIELRAG
jgi:hypothetical protein